MIDCLGSRLLSSWATRLHLGLLMPCRKSAYTRVMSRWPARVLFIAFVAACAKGSDDHPPAAPSTGPIRGTDQETLVPARPRGANADKRKPSDATNLQAMLSEGWGNFSRGPGEAPVVRLPNASASPPPPGAHRVRLARFVHLADFQLADDKSPARVVALDTPVAVDGSFRPQESMGCRVIDAVARTINRIHESGPLDLVLLGGDNVDNAQGNELTWLFGVLDGGATLACDSGAKDDPVPGPDNDGKDPFVPEGLAPPWYWVTGNHDVLSQGNFEVTATRRMEAVSDTSTGGTRVYSKAGASVVQGTVVPDPARTMMYRSELMARIAADTGRAGPRGHGLGAYAEQHKKAFYTVDLPGSPVRFLVLDTSAETGGADGVLHRADVDAFVAPELARAVTEQKYLVLASHHAIDRLTDGSGVAGTGTLQPDAILPEEWEKTLGANHNVILDLVGHAHDHRIRRLGQAPGGFWEVQTDAIADYPHQLRLVEIWDEDNTWLSIRSVVVDYSTEGNRVAASGRELGILDYTIGWSCCGPGTAADRNVILWQKKP